MFNEEKNIKSCTKWNLLMTACKHNPALIDWNQWYFPELFKYIG